MQAFWRQPRSWPTLSDRSSANSPFRYGNCLGLAQPVNGMLPLREPSGREDRRLLERRFTTGFDRVWKPRRCLKRHFFHAGRAVARNDAVIAPLHDARSGAVAKFTGVNQKTGWPHLFGLQRKERQRGFESAVGHLARQPAQFENPVLSMVENDAPRVPGEL